jgi:hypothetical protein
MRKIFTLVAAMAWLLCGTIANCRGDIVWQSAGYTDEQAITNGSTLPVVNFSVAFSTVAFSDSDGGTFDLGAGASASFFSYEGGVLGTDSGYLEMSFNNQNDDPADYLEMTLQFSHPLINLQFSLLDVDRSNGNTNVDAVEVFYNGINVRTNPLLFSLGSAVALDDESYMNGFEGITAAGSNSAAGNIAFDFSTEIVNSITIRYFSSDDANNNPTDQSIGIGDMLFTAIPEPTALVWCSLLVPVLFTIRRRRI